MKRSVLFVCTGNSARSQMAEALLRSQAADHFDVFSAGTDPESVDPRAIDVLMRFDVSTKGLYSKGLDQHKDRQFDFVISLCDKAQRECRQFSYGKEHLAWNFEDPKTRPGTNPFEVTLKELNERIKMFVLIHCKEEGTD